METHQIFGQDKLINNLTTIFEIFKNTEGEIKPHLFLTGPSGSGKTLTITTLCEFFEFGFVEVNAAQLTKEGVSGNSLSKALSPLTNMSNKLTIVFVDEFDKLFIAGNSNSMQAHESTVGVQNEFLKVLEGTTASVFGDYGKYNQVSTSKCLFIFSGAFNNEEDLTIDRLRELGVKTEFLGRVGIIYNTKPLKLEDLYGIVDTSPLLAKYIDLFDKSFELETIKDKIKAKIAQYYEMNTLGSRMINTLIHQYFINKGKFDEEDIKKSTFTSKLSF